MSDHLVVAMHMMLMDDGEEYTWPFKLSMFHQQETALEWLKKTQASGWQIIGDYTRDARLRGRSRMDKNESKTNSKKPFLQDLYH